MLRIKFILVGLLATVTLLTNSFAETPSKLNGMWILDAAATEQFFSSSPPPSNAKKVAEWFGIVGGYMSLFSYQFSGDTVIEDAYGGRGKRTEYRLLSEQGTERTYAQTGTTGGQGTNTLSVSLLKSGGLKIIKSGMGEPMGYLLWKKSSVTNEQVTRDEVMAASNTWLKSMQNIVKLLNGTPN